MLVSERVDGLSLVVDSSMHDQRGRRALRAGRASGEDFGKKAAQLNWVGTQSPEDALRAIEDVRNNFLLSAVRHARKFGCCHNLVLRIPEGIPQLGG